jgi:ADP-heptose:LPS heptosyltransferase
MNPSVLVARLDNNGDVLLAGPAVRAVAAGASEVTLLCGARGIAAAHLLPGVDRIVQFTAPWIDPDPAPVDRVEADRLVARISAIEPDIALILTSFHQSPLPLALLLRMAGVPCIAAISEDYPGSLLDIRHRVGDDLHEVERGLSLALRAGFELPDGDDGSLRIRPHASEVRPTFVGYVVVHPGASVTARAWSPARNRELVRTLADDGWPVVVTAGPDETELAVKVAGPQHPLVANFAGQVTLAGLAALLERARALVVGNTGPAHLAAAVGTPVVSLFAPTVPASRWRPWQVPHLLLGDQGIACAGCRARSCPVAGHPCLSSVDVADVIRALHRLAVPRPLEVVA